MADAILAGQLGPQASKHRQRSEIHTAASEIHQATSSSSSSSPHANTGEKMKRLQEQIIDQWGSERLHDWTRNTVKRRRSIAPSLTAPLEMQNPETEPASSVAETQTAQSPRTEPAPSVRRKKKTLRLSSVTETRTAQSRETATASSELHTTCDRDIEDLENQLQAMTRADRKEALLALPVDTRQKLQRHMLRKRNLPGATSQSSKPS
eukprot:gnl/MRDRNA2_/MRDRNA2_160212_c0_seq1.p1 gnl/MRDRNA2_/MRDRNA2_160212_c0~~gnl/MRDRNA2_/MRDRNA2_160212_c0_seq1.p1  ORF type:complete len:208 (+),score=34.06 gnl/MRDRNA2_/MRDRNA2_160212_c0_seq1:222-845(+)